jgi:hypothetical protein
MDLALVFVVLTTHGNHLTRRNSSPGIEMSYRRRGEALKGLDRAVAPAGSLQGRLRSCNCRHRYSDSSPTSVPPATSAISACAISSWSSWGVGRPFFRLGIKSTARVANAVAPPSMMKPCT